ncbi:hypothetical protein [Dyella nitratireducens]|uniref:Uncharacterized protein n=1 Tax=Dyella nitratireducens TaxID=1849580 RepID=A0ABQ1G170_9GAMM|nr:hypothetical protein [Dyella nitratireducens]GGA35412.1 hypothetical protein GCM10010981_25630 [Dyella nitratireducens]GLQ40998.1 hypothetical protein GCM10007902_08480 [Dyella nitratireducens]
MRSCLAALCLASLPLTVLADSLHTLEVINDTRSSIDSFAVAPAGSGRWTEVRFKSPMQESWFDYELAVTVQFHDDEGCFRDLRTMLSDGRRIFARNFNICQYDSYRPGIRFRNGHPGSRIMP